MNGVHDDESLNARFDMVPALRDRSSVETLSGGITNRNFRITTPAGVVVARVSTPDSSVLGIDRAAEHHNSVSAAQSGAGAPVLDYSRAAGILVVGWIEGRTYEATDLHDLDTLSRVAQACRTLHAGPPFVNDFNMFEVQRNYLHVVHERGLRLPDRYEEFASRALRIEVALAAHPARTVPCNNDLLPGNIIDDGARLWLIDYEYSGNNDPSFEIGNIWSEATLPDVALDHLVGEYWGRASAALIARARLWALISKYGWMLWASIQAGTSDIEFDFWTWGMEKYNRAVAEFESLHFSRWLDDAAAAWEPHGGGDTTKPLGPIA